MQVMKTNTFDFLNDIKLYGLKYDQEIELKEIAKMIRKELKPLVKLGFKFSVRTKHYTTIDIMIIDIPIDFILYNPYYDQQASWEFSVGKRTEFDPEKDLTGCRKMNSRFIKAFSTKMDLSQEQLSRAYLFFI